MLNHTKFSVFTLLPVLSIILVVFVNGLMAEHLLRQFANLALQQQAT